MRMFVIGFNIHFDFGNKLFDTFECSTSDRLLRDEIEPDFYLI